jgi:hypothetical protein
MSRLHEMKTKGVDNVLLPKHMRTESIQTVGDRMAQICTQEPELPAKPKKKSKR